MLFTNAWRNRKQMKTIDFSFSSANIMKSNFACTLFNGFEMRVVQCFIRLRQPCVFHLISIVWIFTSLPDIVSPKSWCCFFCYASALMTINNIKFVFVADEILAVPILWYVLFCKPDKTSPYVFSTTRQSTFLSNAKWESKQMGEQQQKNGTTSVVKNFFVRNNFQAKWLLHNMLRIALE